MNNPCVRRPAISSEWIKSGQQKQRRYTRLKYLQTSYLPRKKKSFLKLLLLKGKIDGLKMKEEFFVSCWMWTGTKELQCHRTIEYLRLKGASGTLLLKQSHMELAAHNHVQMTSEHLQGWSSTSLSTLCQCLGKKKNPKKPFFLMFKEHSAVVYLRTKNGSSKNDLPLWISLNIPRFQS